MPTKVEKWEELSRETAFYNKYDRGIEKVRYKLPDGTESDFYIKKEKSAICVLALTKDKKVVLAKQFRPGPNEIILELPGGGIEKGEDQRAALNREIMDEAGIDISKYPVFLVQEATGESEKTLKETGERVFVKMKFFTYKLIMDDKDSSSIKVTLSDEHIKYKWVKTSELKNLKLTSPSVDLFKKLGYL